MVTSGQVTSGQLLKTRFFSSKLATHIKFKSWGGPVWLHKERSPSHVTELVTFWGSLLSGSKKHITNLERLGSIHEIRNGIGKNSS